MGVLEIIIISIGLAMDAFAVSVCKGLAMKKIDFKKMIIIGLYFGGFQGLMPLIGYLLGTNFESFVTKIDHWIAFILLSIIGINMIKEAIKSKEECECESHDDSVAFKTMVVLAIATSIDALAVGITLAFLKANLLAVVLSIGLITLVLSMIGVWIGNKFGCKYEKRAQVTGGLILIIMGSKILIEHIGLL